jgi:ketosteroid isomerase-like protein
MAVAKKALSPRDAYLALTRGGRQATGIDSTADRVVWSRPATGTPTPTTVEIGGHLLVADGELTTRADVEEARRRIAETLERDAVGRRARHEQLSALMPHYLLTIGKQKDEG